MAFGVLFLFLICSWVEQVSSVTFPEQDWSELIPHLVVGPVFAEDVCSVATTGDVLEVHGVGCNGFTCEVVGQGMVSLLEHGVWNRSIGHDGAIVPKQAGWSIDGDPKVTQGLSLIHI